MIADTIVRGGQRNTPSVDAQTLISDNPLVQGAAIIHIATN